MEVTLTEADLFRLSEYVDQQLESSDRFKNEGVLLFNVAEGYGGGTPLKEFLMKYSDGLEDSVKRLNPISVPQSKEFYGHMAFSSTVLDQEEVKSCTSVLDEPSEYSVSPDNCCMSAMRENGVAGLLSHYFHDELPAHAMNPPRFQCFHSPTKLGKKAAAKGRGFMKTKEKLDSMSSIADKAVEMTRILDSQKHRKGEADGLGLKPGEEETANYYKGKGFMYASEVNVNAEKRNRVSANFSLSFLNHLTLTSLLDGFFPDLPLIINNITTLIHSDTLPFNQVLVSPLRIIVPPSSVAKLQYFLSREFTCSGHGSCIGVLGHKYHLPTPSWLEKNGIPFNVVFQQRGQGIIVAPNAAHMGFNLGPNVAEAINFASQYWIPFGIVYPKCTCMAGQVHADLSTIISTFSPEMLAAYQHQKIPCTISQAHFNKCIVFPYLWKEAFQSARSEDVDFQPPSSDEDDASTFKCDVSAGSESSCKFAKVAVQTKRLKKCPNRKDIICPVCSMVYRGGQKNRLFNHFKAAHSQLTDDERRRAEDLLNAMFPQWGTKLPKKTCPNCGKAVARSLKAHQKSGACKLPA